MNRMILIGLMTVSCAMLARAQQPIYLDPAQPIDQRVEDLLSRLKLEEKTSLLSTTAPAIERLHIPVMNGWNQSLHGIVWTKPTTMFPVPISMAATWNPALIRDVAGAIADEGRAVYNLWQHVPGKMEGEDRGQLETVTANGERLRHNGLVYRSPVVNMDRDPRWGRIWEAFGEDPVLVSRMTVAYIKGTQGENPKYLKLAATPKHFAVNNQERDRVSSSATVPERILREYFLPQFKAAVTDAHAQSIMSSYNAINGVPNAENKMLLTDILRDEWKFDGFVVPDSGAVEDLVQTHRKYKTLEEAAARTILAGSDLDNGAYARVIPKALEQGLLTEKDVDGALRRVLTVRFRLGEFDPPDAVPFSKLGPEVIDSREHRELALRLARESIVLLKNENGFLPLDKTKIKSIAVIGPFADFAQTGPNYTGLYSKFVKPLEGIRNRAGSSIDVRYARGSGILESDDPERSSSEAAALAKKCDVAVLFVGTNETTEREGIDRESLGLPPVQLQLVRRVLEVNPKTAIVLLNGGPVSLVTGAGRGAPRFVENPAVLDMFWAGEEGGNAIADVLFGNYNPGGKLPYTVYNGTRDIPPMTEYDIAKGFTYMYFDGKPGFAFGHGLSYTSFQYSNVSVSPGRLDEKTKAKIKVDVRNSGNLEGDEVVQLYVHERASNVPRPKQQLAAFERIHLAPGEKKTVMFTVAAEQLAFWDTEKHRFTVDPGSYDILVGSASDDIRQTARLEVAP
jgi:beta-glucosidase